MQQALILSAIVLSLLAGCAGTPRGDSSLSTPVVTTGKLPLGSEQQRLAELFRGTPVVFQMQADGSLRIEVPLRFSFDRGASAVKPPLAALLDRVAQGQQNQATRVRIAAPLDAGVRTPVLAKERAASTRDYLVARGIAVTRFAALTASGGDVLEITLAD